MILSGERLGKLLAIALIEDGDGGKDAPLSLDDDDREVLKKIEICRESLTNNATRSQILQDVSQTLLTTTLPLPESMMSFFVALMMKPAPQESLKIEPCGQLFKLLNSSFEFFDLYTTVFRSYYRIAQQVPG